jgi:hypothetical protein
METLRVLARTSQSFVNFRVRHCGEVVALQALDCGTNLLATAELIFRQHVLRGDFCFMVRFI